MKRPAFQFYPRDWSGNKNLRRCTFAERGIWMDVLCLLHDSEDYGVLRWPLEELAQAVGCRQAELQALRRKGVLKGADVGEAFAGYVFTPRHAGQDGEPVTLLGACDGPLWFASRMVRDEYVRTKRGLGSRFDDQPKGGIGDGGTPEPMDTFGDGPIASTAVASALPPSLRSGGGTRAKGVAAIPADFTPSEGTQNALGREGFSPYLDAHLAYFRDYCVAKDKRYKDFDAAFRNCVRSDWGDVRAQMVRQNSRKPRRGEFEGVA